MFEITTLSELKAAMKGKTVKIYVPIASSVDIPVKLLRPDAIHYFETAIEHDHIVEAYDYGDILVLTILAC